MPHLWKSYSFPRGRPLRRLGKVHHWGNNKKKTLIFSSPILEGGWSPFSSAKSRLCFLKEVRPSSDRRLTRRPTPILGRFSKNLRMAVRQGQHICKHFAKVKLTKSSTESVLSQHSTLSGKLELHVCSQSDPMLRLGCLDPCLFSGKNSLSPQDSGIQLVIAS